MRRAEGTTSQVLSIKDGYKYDPVEKSEEESEEMPSAKSQTIAACNDSCWGLQTLTWKAWAGYTGSPWKHVPACPRPPCIELGRRDKGASHIAFS